MKPRAQARPAGFNRPAAKRTETVRKSKKQLAAEKRRERARIRAMRAQEKQRRREERRQRRENLGPEERKRLRGRIAAIALTVLLLGLAALIVFGGQNKTVHQMPTIQREKTESEAEAS